jgi:hypothetical protein
MLSGFLTISAFKIHSKLANTAKAVVHASFAVKISMLQRQLTLVNRHFPTNLPFLDISDRNTFIASVIHSCWFLYQILATILAVYPGSNAMIYKILSPVILDTKMAF